MKIKLAVLTFSLLAFGIVLAQTSAPILPAVDAASAASLTTVVSQEAVIQSKVAALQAQIAPLTAQLQTLEVQRRIAQGKALAAAGLDPQVYYVTIAPPFKFASRGNRFTGR